MITRPTSAPASSRTSSIWSGAWSLRPGWIRMAAPVSCCARAPARSTLRSLSLSGHVQPSSPITPAGTPVSPMPVVRSATISSASSSTVLSSIVSSWDAAT